MPKTPRHAQIASRSANPHGRRRAFRYGHAARRVRQDAAAPASAGAGEPGAEGNRAVLVRGRSAATYRLHLGDLLYRGNIAANAPVEPGDIVMIPQSPL